MHTINTLSKQVGIWSITVIMFQEQQVNLGMIKLTIMILAQAVPAMEELWVILPSLFGKILLEWVLEEPLLHLEMMPVKSLLLSIVHQETE